MDNINAQTPYNRFLAVYESQYGEDYNTDSKNNPSSRWNFFNKLFNLF